MISPIKISFIAVSLFAATFLSHIQTGQYVVGQAFNFGHDTFASSTLALIRLLRDEAHILNTLWGHMPRRDPVGSSMDSNLQELYDYMADVQKLVSAKPNTTTEYLEDFYGHPINAFVVIKAWARVYNYLERNQHVPAVQSIRHGLETARHRIPSHHDEDAMVMALLRLQHTYDLHTDDMAQGVMAGHPGMQPLTGRDCMRLGLAAFDTQLYTYAKQWFHLIKADDERLSDLTVAARKDLFDKLHLIAKSEGNFAAATGELESAINEDRDDAWLAEKLRELRRYMYSFDDPPPVPLPMRAPTAYDENTYHKLCQGPLPRKLNTTRGYKYGFCRMTGVYPYFRYKQEIFHTYPLVSFFHDVITQSQMNLLKQMGSTRLERSGLSITHDAKTMDSRRLMDIRTSNTAWLWDTENSDLARLTRKVQDMTSLKVLVVTGDAGDWINSGSTAEAYQILNYGFGGHYHPHLDMLGEQEDTNNLGDRIATYMFYLSTVKEGGATVFPDLKLRVPAIKGGAAFWHNLNKEGAWHRNTLHAGCPVMIGHKWAANKWIRYKGQLFARPCGLFRNSVEKFKL